MKIKKRIMVFKTINSDQRRKEKSRKDETLSIHCAVPAGLGRLFPSCHVRRLKSTVNKMPSLRDSFPLTRHFYKLFISDSLKK